MPIIFISCKKIKNFSKLTITDLSNNLFLMNINISFEKFCKLSQKQKYLIFKKIYSILYDNKIFTAVLDKNLYKSIYFKELFIVNKINIISGKKVMPNFIPQILSCCNISFKSNTCIIINNDIINYKNEIILLAKYFNTLIIKTNTPHYINKICDEIYTNLGVYIPIVTKIPNSINLIVNFDEENLKINIHNLIDLTNNKILLNNKETLLNLKIPNAIPLNNFNCFQICEAYLKPYINDLNTFNTEFEKYGFKLLI